MNREEQILEWKKEYGEVYGATLGEYEFYFKLISYAEYQTIQNSTVDELQADEAICRLCVLSPKIEDWSEAIFAGYTDTIARLVKEESLLVAKNDGVDDVKKRIADGLEHMNNSFMAQLPVIIAKAFPQYLIEDLEKMTLSKQVDLYVGKILLVYCFTVLKTCSKVQCICLDKWL